MKWFGWFRKKEDRLCQCGHDRCYHTEGKRRCYAHGEGDEIFCTCDVYIPSDEPEVPKDVKELERMMKL